MDACPGEAIQDRTSGHYCAREKCGRWTREWEETVHIQRYDQNGGLVGEEIHEDDELVESWDAENLKDQERQKCLDELARGGCCDPEQDPPEGYTPCLNGEEPHSGD